MELFVNRSHLNFTTNERSLILKKWNNTIFCFNQFDEDWSSCWNFVPSRLSLANYLAVGIPLFGSLNRILEPLTNFVWEPLRVLPTGQKRFLLEPFFLSFWECIIKSESVQDSFVFVLDYQFHYWMLPFHQFHGKFNLNGFVVKTSDRIIYIIWPASSLLSLELSINQYRRLKYLRESRHR